MKKPLYSLSQNLFCITPAGVMRLAPVVEVVPFQEGQESAYFAYWMELDGRKFLKMETEVFPSVTKLTNYLKADCQKSLEQA